VAYELHRGIDSFLGVLRWAIELRVVPSKERETRQNRGARAQRGPVRYLILVRGGLAQPTATARW